MSDRLTIVLALGSLLAAGWGIYALRRWGALEEWFFDPRPAKEGAA